MLEQFYTQTSVITQFRRGLLGAYLDDLAATLHEQGYAHASIRCSLRHCDQFGHWLDTQRYTVAEVDETLVEQYLHRFPRSRNGRRPKEAQGLPHLIRTLRQHDIIPPPNGSGPMPHCSIDSRWKTWSGFSPPTTIPLPHTYGIGPLSCCSLGWGCEPMKSLPCISRTLTGMQDGSASVPVRPTASGAYL